MSLIGKGRYVQSIPGSGKTTLTRSRPGKFVDSDDLVASVGFAKGTKADYEEIKRTPLLRAALVDLMEMNRENGYIVLCNFDPEEIGLETSARYRYRPGEYIRHLKLAGRDDLLESFSPSVLTAWATAYAAKPKVQDLEIGTYLSDVVALVGSAERTN